MEIHVVTSPCIGTKDGACAKVCPIECFYDAGEMLMINPDECIGCALCVSECPVSAIYANSEVPEQDRSHIQRARAFFAEKDGTTLAALRVK